MTAPVLHEGPVVLRPLRASDRDDRRRHGWWAAIERGYGHVEVDRPMTDAEADLWLERVAEHATDTWWIVEADAAAAGVAFLHSFDGGRARFAVGLFSPSLQGRGLGSAATRAVLRHAFAGSGSGAGAGAGAEGQGLGLAEVDLRVLEFNDAAIRCYEACGFRTTGREIGSCEIEGALYDDIVMTATPESMTAAVRLAGRRQR